MPLAAERHEGYDTEAFISVPFNLHNCHVPSVPSVLLWVLEMFLKVTTSQCTLIIAVHERADLSQEELKIQLLSIQCGQSHGETDWDHTIM